MIFYNVVCRPGLSRAALVRVLTGLLVASAALVCLPVTAQTELAQGEVRRLDIQNGKVTIRHGEIKTLDMPPMTMVFVAQPKSILQGVKVGDKVRFLAADDNGVYVVRKIEPESSRQ